MKDSYDILIVGGGLVGATLALALRGCGLAVLVLEARPKGVANQDARVLALSTSSRLILQRLGMWSQLAGQATPIATIHVSQRGRFGRSVLKAADERLPALGYVLPYAAFSDVLDHALRMAGDIAVVHGARAVAIECQANQARVHFLCADEQRQAASRLVVLADGGCGLSLPAGMKRRIHDYGHSAVVARVISALPHAHTAYERFTPAGPLALLPQGVREFALVWTAAVDRAQALAELSEAEFLAQLNLQFGDRCGHFTAVGRRATFPLKLAWLRPVTAPHLAVIGNAAQTLHPIAAQGLNLGLRDAWELAQVVLKTGAKDIGGAAMLAHYHANRRCDTAGGTLFTDFLVRAFTNEIPGFGLARATGLVAVELVSPLKHYIVRKMSFGAHG